jgi:hypothetical protein
LGNTGLSVKLCGRLIGAQSGGCLLSFSGTVSHGRFCFNPTCDLGYLL